MSRLPQPGSDSGSWGTVLNDFLSVELNTDGTLKRASDIAGKEPSISAGTTTQYYRGDKSWVTLDKVAVGLTNVDNTGDSAKPVSAATQMALNLKLTASSNLSDVTTPATARTNLGLGAAATMTPATLAADSAFTSTYAPLIAQREQDALLARGASDRQRSVALARVAYEDAASIVELWADQTSWTNAGVGSVSGGFLLGSTGGANSGHNRTFVVTALQTMRAIFTVVLSSNNGNSIIVGVDSHAAGTGVDAANIRGIQFRSATLYSYDQTVATSLVSQGALVVGKTYTVTLTADANWISCVVVAADGSYGEWRTRFARSGFNINNLSAFNSDTVSGNKIGPVGARRALTTVTPRTGIEGIVRTIQWTSVGTAGIKIILPSSYDPRVPMPLAICFHGNGTDENINITDGNEYNMIGPLLAGGYIVLTAAFTTTPSSWGAQGSLDAYYVAYKYARDNYAIGPVVFHANSMGGIESLLVLAERRIPGVVAWAGSNATSNLAACYSEGTISFTSTIRTAYGIASDGSDYAAKTVGHDPMLMNGLVFRGVPMKFWVASDDTVVLPSSNSDLFITKVTPFAQVVERVNTTGGHGTPASFPGVDIVAWFDRFAVG